MNQWEEHFQRYVQGRTFRCDRIPEGKSKRPDFEITAGNLPHKIVAEVKTLSPNELDKRLEKHARESAERIKKGAIAGEPIAYWPATDRSIREHLKDAVKQFKAYSPATASNVVVLYSERLSELGKIDPDTVEEALFGDHQYHFQIGEDGSALPAGTSRTNKFFRQDRHQIVSAVACLQEPETNKFFVFHNPYAENRMPFFLFADGQCVQYVPERIKGRGSALVPYKITL